MKYRYIYHITGCAIGHLTVAITEIGKERGNNLELKEVKKGTEETNQKNDLFNSWLKMCRHSATIDNYPFIKVITDEQRPESWGADARDLSEIVHIVENSDIYLAMPGLGVFDLLYSLVFGKFENLYYKYRFNRSDNTVFMHMIKNIFGALNHFYHKLYNQFGFSVSKLEVELGTQDGKKKNKKYYLMNKKIYSNRFSTDCFSDYFNDIASKTKVGLDDYDEYVKTKASIKELRLQNSYFINSLYKNND